MRDSSLRTIEYKKELRSGKACLDRIFSLQVDLFKQISALAASIAWYAEHRRAHFDLSESA